MVKPAIDFGSRLRPSRLRWFFVGAIALLFCALGVFILKDHAVQLHVRIIGGYGGTVFGGLGAVVSMIQFVPGGNYLEIKREGIIIRTAWREASYQWTEIERFGVTRIPTPPLGRSRRMVGYDFSSAYSRLDQHQRLRKMNKGLCGFEAALADTYGFSVGDLADNLNRLRTIALGESVG